MITSEAIALQHQRASGTQCFYFLCEIWDILAEKQKEQVCIQIFSQN